MKLNVEKLGLIVMPLYDMVRELAEKKRGLRTFLEIFNALPLENQLQHFQTMEDKEKAKLRELANRIFPGEIADLGISRQGSRDCVQIPSTTMELYDIFFINGRGKKIYLEARFEKGDVKLSPQIVLQGGIYVYQRRLFPGSYVRREVRGAYSVPVDTWSGAEGTYCLRNPERHRQESSTDSIGLKLDVKETILNEKSLKLLKDSVSG